MPAPSLAQQLRPLLSPVEWAAIEDRVWRLDRNRTVRRRFRQLVREGMTVADAREQVATEHALSPHTVDAVAYPRRR